MSPRADVLYPPLVVVEKLLAGLAVLSPPSDVVHSLSVVLGKHGAGVIVFACCATM